MRAHDDDDSDRQSQYDRLAAQIRACRRCERMNILGETQAAPGHGCLRSPVVIVGQSLCRRCMETQIPFTGGSGLIIDRALGLAGIAKDDIFTTNVVHCHPPDNRASLRHEIENCRPYLHRELDIVRPKLVIGLGQDAKAALQSAHPETQVLPWPFTVPHATGPEAARSPDLLFAPHPSWIVKQHKDSREQYVTSLARALKWSFRDQ